LSQWLHFDFNRRQSSIGSSELIIIKFIRITAVHAGIDKNHVGNKILE
jgi:hypothetical protein